ncbi:MAG: acetolactate synthase large subunit [Desulfatirhabdiaceae bacterium]
MNGAQTLLNALVNAGVTVCFANPGTSEMHLVMSIGKTDAVRPVLCLFEGVATGAADGYARMTDKPAITLLHLGPGLSNGMANLHNARKAHVPLVNIVGDHATHHLQYETPLRSDVPAHARICSDWVGISQSPDDLAAAGLKAVEAAMTGSGKIATLIVPANHAWETANTLSLPPVSMPGMARVQPDVIDDIAALLKNGKRSALLLGGRGLREDALAVAGAIASATGADILSETFPAHMHRGAGRVKTTRIPYFVEKAIESLQKYDQIILVGGLIPVAFFAYPDTPGLLAKTDCTITTLTTSDQCPLSALKLLAGILNVRHSGILQEQIRLPQPSGKLTPQAIGRSLNNLLPENAILSDEAVTSALEIFACTEGAAPHDWLGITGGSIGQGLPVSLGAAIACPDRKVIALQADGSAMYTVQTLWTMAREKTDVTVILMNNRSYAILNIELARVGAGQPNEKTLSMFNLAPPDLDWVQIAGGMGVPASRATTAEEFHQQLSGAMRQKGPFLIEAVL